MDIVDVKHQAKKDRETSKFVFNPLQEDITVYYDKLDKNIQLTVPSKESKKFPTYLANHVGKHIINAYVQTKPSNIALRERKKRARKLVFND